MPGIGRFANRKAAAKAAEPSNPTNATASPSRDEDEWMDTEDQFQESNGQEEDFSFANDDEGFSLNDDGASAHKTFADDMSLGVGSFVGSEGFSEFVDEAYPSNNVGENQTESTITSASTQDGTKTNASGGFARFSKKSKTPETETEPNKNTSIEESLAAPGLTLLSSVTDATNDINLNSSRVDSTNTSAFENARHKGSFSFSRSAQKGKTLATNSDVDANTKDQDETKMDGITVTPNRGDTNDSAINDLGCNGGRETNDNGQNKISNTSNIHETKKIMPHTPMMSLPPDGKVNPSSIAMNASIATHYHDNTSEQSRRVSFEKPVLLSKRPCLREEEIQKQQYTNDKQQHQEEEKMAVETSADETRHQCKLSSTSQKSRSKIPSSSAAKESEILLFQQNEENSNQRFANVTNNRIIRKKIYGAAAVTPNSLKARFSEDDDGDSTGSQTSILPMKGINKCDQATGGTPSIQGVSRNVSTENNTNRGDSNLDGFEATQDGFLNRIRETEDLQSHLGSELLKTNEEFADVYHLLLRDLEERIDLLDKVEDISKRYTEEEAKDKLLLQEVIAIRDSMYLE